MTPKQLIDFYGSPRKAANCLSVTIDRIYRWRERGFVPARMQASIAGWTHGKLKISPPYEAKK